jgi:hypothetical protein
VNGGEDTGGEQVVFVGAAGMSDDRVHGRSGTLAPERRRYACFRGWHVVCVT